ncbi:MAG: type II toxin-antitoxin system VapC family toxin [Alphaproteobacteria bacterium]|nr:type II toxin-antitoxin system VapC family toxin [Alphaproteobacteria bacterium]
MHYFDTSFLVPLILPEATSDKITKFLVDLSAEDLAVSHWTRVEFSSLLAREVRMGGLSAEAAREADVRFEAMVEESFAVILPNGDDFNLAKEYLGNYESGLRAGDALHLAIAKNHRAEAIYSLDKTLLKAGKNIGIPVSLGIRLPSYGD